MFAVGAKGRPAQYGTEFGTGLGTSALRIQVKYLIIQGKKWLGVAGFEPTNGRDQNPLPYHLATPPP